MRLRFAVLTLSALKLLVKHIKLFSKKALVSSYVASLYNSLIPLNIPDILDKLTKNNVFDSF